MSKRMPNCKFPNCNCGIGGEYRDICEDTVKPLKLEIGGEYKNRIGQIFKIVGQFTNGNYIAEGLEGSKNIYYHKEDGTVVSISNTQYSLVERLVPLQKGTLWIFRNIDLDLGLWPSIDPVQATTIITNNGNYKLEAKLPITWRKGEGL